MITKKLVLTALTVTLLGSGAVSAQGNGHGNGNGRSANENGNNGRGAIASELKWRNAAHASEQAFINASPNSAVGKLATLRSATEAAAPIYAAAGVDPTLPLRDPAVIQADIDAISGIGGLIDAKLVEIGALDPLALTYNDDLFRLTGEVAALEADVVVLEAELALPLSPEVQAQAEAEVVVGVETLTEVALEALWGMLNK